MRDFRELSVGPEPLPSGLCLVPPRFPPAPPGTGMPAPHESPRLRLVGLLIPCYEEVINLGGLLKRAEARGSNQDDQLVVNLTAARVQLLARLRRFYGLARTDEGLDEKTLEVFKLQLLLYAAGRGTVDPLSAESRRVIQQSLLIGAEGAGFKAQELGLDRSWSFRFRGLNSLLPPRMFLHQTALELAFAANQVNLPPDPLYFERALFHPMATVMLAALEVVSLNV